MLRSNTEVLISWTFLGLTYRTSQKDALETSLSNTLRTLVCTSLRTTYQTLWKRPHKDVPQHYILGNIGTSSGLQIGTSYFNVLRTLVEDILRSLVGDYPWRYIDDQMERSIGRFLGRHQDVFRDVFLPSGQVYNKKVKQCQLKSKRSKKTLHTVETK